MTDLNFVKKSFLFFEMSENLMKIIFYVHSLEEMKLMMPSKI